MVVSMLAQRSPDHIIVPAIICYELRRVLLRANKTFGVSRIDAFVSKTSGRYLPLTDEALRLAAELWATARQQRRSTADAKVLDIDVILVDVILAAQGLSFESAPSDVVVATSNSKHLSQFINARNWSEILP
jgi:hypothetical protein